METIFNWMYFLVTSDPQYPSVRDFYLGLYNAEADVFMNTLLLSLLIALAVCILFYLILNRFWKMNYIWAWSIAMLVVGISCFGVSYYFVGSYVYLFPDPIEPAGWKFVGMSTIWGMIYYYAFSHLLKHASIFAKKIPHSIRRNRK